MSSSDRATAQPRRFLAVAAALLALASAAGCTVQPLYGTTTGSTGGQGVETSRLAMVEVRPARDRVGQEVRNHLIFLLGGGGGQPADPAYHLDVTATAADSRPSTVSTRRVALEPTAGIVTVRGAYKLSEARSGAVISSGVRAVQAPYDIPVQDYAARRAQRDAENRASRELAEILRLVVAQELEKATSTSVPVVAATPEEIEEQDLDGQPAGL